MRALLDVRNPEFIKISRNNPTFERIFGFLHWKIPGPRKVGNSCLQRICCPIEIYIEFFQKSRKCLELFRICIFYEFLQPTNLPKIPEFRTSQPYSCKNSGDGCARRVSRAQSGARRFRTRKCEFYLLKAKKKKKTEKMVIFSRRGARVQG